MVHGDDVNVNSPWLGARFLQKEALWVLCCFCARTQTYMAMQWGKTGNVQPGLDVGMSLSAAVWAHVKLKPITKLYFNYSWVQLITIFSNICRGDF